MAAKRFSLNRRQLNAPISVVALVAIGLFVLCLGMIIAPGPVSEELNVFWQQPLLIILNAFPVFAMLIVLWAIIGNVFFAGAATLSVMDALEYINLLKIEGRDDPFVPADVLLIREGLAAAGDYELKLHPLFLAAIVGCTAALIALGVFFRTANPKPVWRAVIGVTVCAAFVASVPTVYADKELYNEFDVPSRYNITSVYNTLGFHYCFLHNFNLYSVDQPEGYSRAQVEAWTEEDLAPEQDSATRPNVLFVMCEAFSDIANDPSLDYPDGMENPLAPFNALAADTGRAYSGHLVVSDYGAGTANTEFDVLTGLPTRMLSERMTSAFRTVRRSLNTIPRLFARQGYATYFMHPGDSWFYNRSSVYSFFGIDDQVFFDDAFTASDIKGNMVSDEAFLRVLKEDFSQRIAADAPLFAYTVTIENHQAYNSQKYNDPSILTARPTSKALSDEDLAALNVYLYGLADSARMVSQLAEYLDTLTEPTLLVFFGDHRPTLGTDYSVYRALGIPVGQTDTPEGLVFTNQTPFLLWANRAYADEFAARISGLDLPDNGILSDHYLGAAVMELVGYAGKDAYYDFLNQARRSLPVLCGGTYMLQDGTCPQTLAGPEQLLVDKTHHYLYYRIKEQPLLQ